jgi:peptidyl-tRNA hydrolase (EC 3.1.1.29)
VAAALRAIIGLGNPGAQYAATRHNAGFWFVDALADFAGVSLRDQPKFHGALAKMPSADGEILLLEPMTFMNDSGRAVQALATFYKLPPESLLVVHDELDLPAGTARLKRGGGHGGHNGLRSIQQHIGPEFARLRIGIGHPGHRDRVLGYVLGRPGSEEHEAIGGAIRRAAEALDTLLAQGWDKAAQQLHTESSPG